MQAGHEIAVASASSTGSPMRVMMRMLATT